MPCVAGELETKRSGSEIFGVAQVTARRLRDLEQLLAEVLHLLVAVRDD